MFGGAPGASLPPEPPPAARTQVFGGVPAAQSEPPPSARTQVFGGAANLLGTIASAFSIAQAQSLLEFFLTSAMAKVLTLLAIIIILMIRPQGLFTAKVRT